LFIINEVFAFSYSFPFGVHCERTRSASCSPNDLKNIALHIYGTFSYKLYTVYMKKYHKCVVLYS